MANMGYKSGQGLGKDEQGITTPLIAKKTDKRSAIIIGGDKHPDKKQKLANSRVLLLTNMVGPGEVDKELEGEIKEECCKYGRVLSCRIYEDKMKGTPEEEAVRIFVKFSQPEESCAGKEALDGRFFAGRRVSAFFYDEELFSRGQFI